MEGVLKMMQFLRFREGVLKTCFGVQNHSQDASQHQDCYVLRFRGSL